MVCVVPSARYSSRFTAAERCSGRAGWQRASLASLSELSENMKLKITLPASAYPSPPAAPPLLKPTGGGGGGDLSNTSPLIFSLRRAAPCPPPSQPCSSPALLCRPRPIVLTPGGPWRWWAGPQAPSPARWPRPSGGGTHFSENPATMTVSLLRFTYFFRINEDRGVFAPQLLMLK